MTSSTPKRQVSIAVNCLINGQFIEVIENDLEAILSMKIFVLS